MKLLVVGKKIHLPEGCQSTCAKSAAEARRILGRRKFDMVVIYRVKNPYLSAHNLKDLTGDRMIVIVRGKKLPATLQGQIFQAAVADRTRSIPTIVQEALGPTPSKEVPINW